MAREEEAAAGCAAGCWLKSPGMRQAHPIEETRTGAGTAGADLGGPQPVPLVAAVAVRVRVLLQALDAGEGVTGLAAVGLPGQQMLPLMLPVVGTVALHASAAIWHAQAAGLPAAPRAVAAGACLATARVACDAWAGHPQRQTGLPDLAAAGQHPSVPAVAATAALCRCQQLQLVAAPHHHHAPPAAHPTKGCPPRETAGAVPAPPLQQRRHWHHNAKAHRLGRR